MKKIAVIGLANAQKPKIIMETLLVMDAFHGKDVVFFTEADRGLCIDYVRSQNLNYEVFPNTTLSDSEAIPKVEKHSPDILLSIGWSHKIPESFLKLFPINPVNCHGGYLPDYRGNFSYMHYWANCEEYYGASVHYMDEKFDNGNILVQSRLKLFVEETPAILHQRTAELCALLIPIALRLAESGYEGFQGAGKKRYFYKLTPEEFIEYRIYNENNPEAKRLTPYKNLN